MEQGGANEEGGWFTTAFDKRVYDIGRAGIVVRVENEGGEGGHRKDGGVTAQAEMHLDLIVRKQRRRYGACIAVGSFLIPLSLQHFSKLHKRRKWWDGCPAHVLRFMLFLYGLCFDHSESL